MVYLRLHLPLHPVHLPLLLHLVHHHNQAHLNMLGILQPRTCQASLPMIRRRRMTLLRLHGRIVTSIEKIYYHSLSPNPKNNHLAILLLKILMLPYEIFDLRHHHVMFKLAWQVRGCKIPKLAWQVRGCKIPKMQQGKHIPFSFFGPSFFSNHP